MMKKGIVFVLGFFVLSVLVILSSSFFITAQQGDGIIICHIPPGNPDNAHTIEIGAPVLEVHLAHGDYEGECEIAIQFVDPTPADESSQSNTDIFVNLSSTSGLPSSQHYTILDFADDIALWLRFDDVDENDPNVILDLSGNGNNATLVNVDVFSGGKFGDAASFSNITSNDINDFDQECIFVEDHDSLDLGNSATVSVWVNYSLSFPQNDVSRRSNLFGAWTDIDVGGNSYPVYNNRMPVIFMIYNDATDPSIWNRFAVTFINETGTVTDGSGVTGNIISSNVMAPPGEGEPFFQNWLKTPFINDSVWHNVVLVFNGTDQLLYFDGNLETTYPAQGNAVWEYTEDLFINTCSASYNYVGDLDEVIFFKRALDSIEIGALYDASVVQYEHNFTGLSSGDYVFTGSAVNLGGGIAHTEDRMVTIL